MSMLELEDIQHYLLARPNAVIAQYNFISFRDAAAGRKWVETLAPIVGTAKTVLAASPEDMRWVSLAFTFNGLKKLGVDETSLASFPEGISIRLKVVLSFLRLSAAATAMSFPSTDREAATIAFSEPSISIRSFPVSICQALI